MPIRLVYWMGLCLGFGTSCLGPVPVDTGTDLCLVEAPLPGTITVSPWCDGAQTPGGGEGGAGDLVLANAWLRAILRQPAHALTRPGIGGGTLVDVAPWGFRDRLYEAIPLVGESAIQPDTWEILADGLRIAGPLRPLDGGAAGGGGDGASCAMAAIAMAGAVHAEADSAVWRRSYMHLVKLHGARLPAWRDAVVPFFAPLCCINGRRRV